MDDDFDTVRIRAAAITALFKTWKDQFSRLRELPELEVVREAAAAVYAEHRRYSFDDAETKALAHGVLMLLEMDGDALRRIARIAMPITPDAAYELAVELHGSQVDMAGVPYIFHLDDVVDKLGPDATADEQIVGYLHDTLEDCTIADAGAEGGRRPLTDDDLFMLGVPRYHILAIQMLTKTKSDGLPKLEGESTKDWKRRSYLAKIAKFGTANIRPDIRLIAARVKRADNLSNSDLARRAKLPPEKQAYSAELASKYAASIAMLDDIIAELEVVVEGRTSDPAPATTARP